MKLINFVILMILAISIVFASSSFSSAYSFDLLVCGGYGGTCNQMFGRGIIELFQWLNDLFYWAIRVIILCLVLCLAIPFCILFLIKLHKRNRGIDV